MSTKLTKKQKKAAAFRDRNKKGQLNNLDVPLLDDPDINDGFGFPEETPLAEGVSSAGQKAKKEASKKRKREEDTNSDEEGPARKAKKTENGEKRPSTEVESQKKNHSARKYILFVGMSSLLYASNNPDSPEPGNLSYKTTLDKIQEHFSACDPPPSIRLLTSKKKNPDGTTKPTEKSKGCAFLEFSKASGLQNALRLHHSELDGRKINVELSAGGGGKSEARMKKVQEKNSKLDKHRTESSSRRARPSATEGDEGPQRASAKSRHSNTSGTKVVHTSKPTWSVPKKGEVAGRGGQKHRKHIRGNKQKASKSFDRGWGMTGANAIPLG
ncbi:hypothetical protein CPB86DRAFT_154736 [Serendipita vermifera]|nr:hypothetical protein CPB86DRAFT_154736 [Serendipita vermifera]